MQENFPFSMLNYKKNNTYCKIDSTLIKGKLKI